MSTGAVFKARLECMVSESDRFSDAPYTHHRVSSFLRKRRLRFHWGLVHECPVSGDFNMITLCMVWWCLVGGHCLSNFGVRCLVGTFHQPLSSRSFWRPVAVGMGLRWISIFVCGCRRTMKSYWNIALKTRRPAHLQLKWWFPWMGVPPNHPFNWDFQDINYHSWGAPMTMEPLKWPLLQTLGWPRTLIPFSTSTWVLARWACRWFSIRTCSSALGSVLRGLYSSWRCKTHQTKTYTCLQYFHAKFVYFPERDLHDPKFGILHDNQLLSKASL